MTKYESSDQHDALMIHLWGQIQGGNEMDNLMLPGSRTVAQFCRTWLPPNGALFEADESGIWLFMGVESINIGAFITAWVAPRKRPTKEAVAAVVQGYKIIFTAYPVIFGLTWQEEMLPAHEYFGFKLTPRLKDVVTPDGAWMAWLTREDFERSRAYGRWNVNEQLRDGRTSEHQSVPL